LDVFIHYIASPVQCCAFLHMAQANQQQHSDGLELYVSAMPCMPAQSFSNSNSNTNDTL